MVRPGDDVKISTVSAGRPPEARHFDASCFDVFPAEFLRRRDLRVDRVARFVANTGEDHS